MCFVFGRSKFQVPTRTSSFLTEGFRGFSQSFTQNYGIVSQIRPRPLAFTYFTIHYSLVILTFNATVDYKLFTALLYKHWIIQHYFLCFVGFCPMIYVSKVLDLIRTLCLKVINISIKSCIADLYKNLSV